jgi:hypothetical protein
LEASNASVKFCRRVSTVAEAGTTPEAVGLLYMGDDGPTRFGGKPVCATGREAGAGGSTLI